MSERVTKARYAHKGRLLRLRVVTVRLPNGSETTREIVEHPGAVAVIPVLDDGRILLTRQYRTAARRQMIEIPAGTLETGESPLSCAKREVVEETGCAAKRMHRIFSCYLAPGYSTERIHFFLASDLFPKKVEQPEDETIKLQTISLEEGLRAIRRGQIQDAKTICALYYLEARRKRRRRSGKRHTC